jgi:Fe2+ transport system protein FeoA
MITNSVAPSHTLPLSLAAPGETVRLVEIRLVGDEKQRLQELGLLPGSSLRVVKSDPTFGMIISIRHDGRLAVNHGTARKLIVCLER